MVWFKEDFFKWINKPSCSGCGTDAYIEYLEDKEPETEDEKKWQASEVEVYECGLCNEQERYARYNHPQKLIE